MAEEQYRILVADDDKDFREILATAFEGAGFVVIQARDGEDAVKKAKKEKPHLILLDVEMPKMDGLDALLELQSDPEMASVRKVFLTNYGDPAMDAGWVDQKYAREAGAVAYIKKGSDLGEIVEYVKKLLRINGQKA
jgi:two-component system, OmpR family, alkaline phosphatase synthesis response regulator PhoP